MGPCGLLKHLPSGDSPRHVSTAVLSCTLDCGENAAVEWMEWQVRFLGMYWRRFCTIDVQCARTPARIWGSANKDHTERDPTTRRQAHLSVCKCDSNVTVYPNSCVWSVSCTIHFIVCACVCIDISLPICVITQFIAITHKTCSTTRNFGLYVQLLHIS